MEKKKQINKGRKNNISSILLTKLGTKQDSDSLQIKKTRIPWVGKLDSQEGWRFSRAKQ